MTEYLLRLFILLPLVGGLAWGSLWLWKRFQTGMPLSGGRGARAITVIDVLPMGPGTKLMAVEFAGQQLLIAASRNGVVRLADNAQGDFHVG